MKSLILIALTFCFAIQGKGQNDPELVGTFESSTNQYRLIYIDHGLPKLAVETTSAIELYNTDLSLFATLPISVADTNSYNRTLITRALFDCDTTTIEYLSAGQSTDGVYSRIYRDDGSIFWDFNDLAPILNISLGENESWVVSDENGSYMLFAESIFSSEYSLFHLCGQLPRPLARESDGTILSGIVQQGNNNGFDAYPNPARETIILEYDLQGHKKANLQLFNTSGQLMKEMMLGQAFDFIRLNISDLEQGTYIARITTDDGFELSEKFVKVD
ncbi:T9SS type A sorting domain-containing protein [Cryomorphaceae bacterium 1068]|nr:T9SS type A sorting domain-containing protein [Cryomorphaceae bacterium 1068]